MEEYAEPVTAMLDKFVFFSEDEMKKLDEKNRIKFKDHVDFVSSRIEDGITMPDAMTDYEKKEYMETEEKKKINSEKKSHFDRI